jgi:threonine dehydrogenase-like Zn-dependent dehydrogenase
MKVWKVTNPGSIILEDLGPSEVRPDCVKVKMLAATVSTTEKLVYKGALSEGSYPRVLGRQGVGLVSEVDESVRNFRRGDRCYVSSQVACNECYFCRTGNKSECSHLQTYGKDIDGVLSDFAIVNTDNLYLLPDRITDEQAAFIETTALAINAINTLGIGMGDHVVILGASAFGLIMAQVVMAHQAVPVLVDKRADRLLLAEELGVYYCVNSAKEDVNKKIFSTTGGKMAGRVVCSLECADLDYGECADIVSNYGKIGFVGTDSEINELNVDLMRVITKNVTTYSITHANDNVSAAINLLARGDINVDKLFTPIKFSEIGEYLKKFADGEDYIQLVAKADK